MTGKSKKQQGVVLVVSLVFLIALTAVAAALMQNTTTDMKMSGASEEKVIAIQEAISAVDEVIHEQVTGVSANNDFAAPVADYQQNGAKDVIADLTRTNKDGDISAATVNLASNQFMLAMPCPHAKLASSVQVFTCNILTIQISRTYGRNKTSTVEVNSGIAQNLLK